MTRDEHRLIENEFGHRMRKFKGYLITALENRKVVKQELDWAAFFKSGEAAEKIQKAHQAYIELWENEIDNKILELTETKIEGITYEG